MNAAIAKLLVQLVQRQIGARGNQFTDQELMSCPRHKASSRMAQA
jgi:hypothetical protein